MSFANPLDQIHKVDYEGILIATVVSNEDPTFQERLKVRIEGLHDEYSDSKLPWTAPKKDRGQGPTGSVGSFGPVPVVGSLVFVTLQRGDPHYPIYEGGALTPDRVLALMKTNYPYRYGWVDRAANEFWVDTKPGTVEIHVKHVSGTRIDIDNTGNLSGHIVGTTNIRGDKQITFDGGQSITIKAAQGITLQAGINISMQAGVNISETAGANVNIQSGGATTIMGGANVNISSMQKVSMSDRDGSISPPDRRP